jgi:hypothetical protein
MLGTSGASTDAWNRLHRNALARASGGSCENYRRYWPTLPQAFIDRSTLVKLGLELGFNSKVEIKSNQIKSNTSHQPSQPMVGWSIFQGWLMRLLTTSQLPDA